MNTAGFRGWTASSVPIGLWIVHLTVLAALAQPICDRPELSWIPHALTVGLALGCVPFLLMAARLSVGADPDETEAVADRRFLGLLGLVLGGFSLLLIVAEGLVVLVVDPCL